MGLETRGHAGRGAKGQDIACAAVSTLVQALLVGLRDVAKISEAECERNPSIPLIRVMWPEEKAQELDLLTKTVAFSLKEVASGYAGYVNLVEVWEP